MGYDSTFFDRNGYDKFAGLVGSRGRFFASPSIKVRLESLTRSRRDLSALCLSIATRSEDDDPLCEVDCKLVSMLLSPS